MVIEVLHGQSFDLERLIMIGSDKWTMSWLLCHISLYIFPVSNENGIESSLDNTRSCSMSSTQAQVSCMDSKIMSLAIFFESEATFNHM